MTIVFAEVSSMTPDTGESYQTGNPPDFITQDVAPGQFFQLQGFAAGSGNMGIWLGGPAFGGHFFEIGAVHISPTNGIWNFTFPISQIPDGEYTIALTNGTGASSINSPITTQSFTVDDQAVHVGINSVEGNDTLTDAQAQAGLTVTGTATGSEFQNLVNGQTIQVDIRDSFNNVLFTQDATVTNGAWSASFSAAQAETLAANGPDGYNVFASVTDQAGNAGQAEDQFTSTVCFMPGTKVRVPDGEANVETLKRGDLVVTADGRAEPICWVGRQTVSKIFADPVRVWPIRVMAGALAENVPSRDLLVSPDHAILVDGVLVQAGALVNGTSIVREGDIPVTFTYYHIELADHSLILAENVPSETFVDNVDRLGFDNWDEHRALYPDGQAIQEMPYPRAQSFRQVPQATRQRLSLRGETLVGAKAASLVA